MAFHGRRTDGAGMGGVLFPNANPSLFSNPHSSQLLYPLFPVLTVFCYRVTADLAQSRDGAEGSKGEVSCKERREARDWL